MCDTLCIVPRRSLDGTAYFGKNSDRSPNEPHQVLRFPAAHYAPGEMVKCTYISIPQAEYTRETILFKPSWIWGAEMGVNSSRVAIGNEAVFTRAKKGPPALLGMDMLRLALERADSAEAAVEVLIYLLETYGQGGNCGFDHEFFYDNSFLAADPKRAFILETAGRNYAVTQIEDKNAISNRLSIGANHTARSGLAPGEDFAKRFTEPVYSHFSAAKTRRGSVMERLSPESGAAEIMDILRSHNENVDGREFSRGSVSSVCMHGGGLIGDHTTGSLVAVLRPEKPVTLWCTGSSTPCISTFKPVFWTSDAPPVFNNPKQSGKYWMRREQLHRAVIAGKIDVAFLRKRIYELEAGWQAREKEIMSADVTDTDALNELAREASVQEEALVNEFYMPDWQDIRGGGRFNSYWRKKNGALTL